MLLSFELLATISLFYSHVNAAPWQQHAPIADLSYARYAGTRLTNGVEQFLGMRFAAPAIPPRRFRQAEPPLQEHGLQNATQHGPLCYGVTSPLGSVPATYSEDCLFIDVFAPARRHNSGLKPVMIWFQGGAFVQLYNPNYNGTGLVEAGDVIVVSFNYRAGPYGFLANDELAQEGNLNIGLLDQRMAMRWVQEHISAFGGDPDQVTLFGTSVGGASVVLQTLAYGGQPPADQDIKWRSGIAEANYLSSTYEISEQEFNYQNLLSSTNCSNLDCLRNLPIDQLQAANVATPLPGQTTPALFEYGPVIDNNFFPARPFELLEQGRFAKDRPLIVGTSRTEGTIFVPRANSTAEVTAFLQAQYPKLTDSILATAYQLYNNTPRTVPGVTATLSPYFLLLAELYGDIAFTCPTLNFAQTFSSAGIPTHMFVDHIVDPVELAAGFIVPHTWELQAVWGPEYATSYVALPSATRYLPGGVNAGMVDLVQGYWLSFVKSGGDPNVLRQKGSAAWQTFEVGYIRLQTNGTRMESVEEDLKAKCAFWSSVNQELNL